MASVFGKWVSNFKEYYSKLNPATLSGAIDAIIVEQSDGTFWSSPFHVRFGKLGILQPKEREIDIEVNGRSVDLKMVLDDNGAAYFMPPNALNEENTDLLATQSSILNAVSSTEDLNELLSNEEMEDSELSGIFPLPVPESRTSSRRKSRHRDGNARAADRVLSEPEQSPISSPTGSRPPSPSAKSDSGTTQPSLSARSWSMSDTARLKEDNKSGGVFLHDLASGGEDLSLYLGQPYRDNDDDIESGRGLSMPQSPQPLLVAARTSEVTGSYSNSQASSFNEFAGEVVLSLCGPLMSAQGDCSAEDFQQFRLSWEAFNRDPLRHITNPDLCVLTGDVGQLSKDSKQQEGSTPAKVRCLPWSVFSAQMAAHFAFGRALPNELVTALSSKWFSERSTSLGNEFGSSWFRVLMPRRSKPIAGSGTEVPGKVSGSENLLPVDQTKRPLSASNESGTPNEKTPALLVPSGSMSRLASDVRYATDDDEDDVLAGLVNECSTSPQFPGPVVNVTTSVEKERPPARRYFRRRQISFSGSGSKTGGPRRTRRLTTEQVKSLELSPGENHFAFSLSHQLLGTTRLTCRVFVWRWDDRIVVSDIDGTITKSDVLGQVLPIMGYEWTQPGVSRLFSLLQKNNYKILYLSARAIGLAQQTREYLSSIEGLPPGPLLLSPASLVNAFYKEVIERVPERFKINCLQEIMRLFPSSHEDVSAHSHLPATPFYAGFGNRPNDAKAYKYVLIPPSRIFIINPRAEVRHDASSHFKSTYDRLAEHVDLFFPAYSNSSSPVQDEFSSFQFWRASPDV